ncbi:Ribonuclease H [Thermoanaerobacter mathranii subsp. mathranii str. A3]|jgi:ribonuclease HI|uniref:Ribonuclease H n=2 Tax=Thermoanaerobacter TaxID=1754 RepID=A0ABT9M6S8_9THEO|nr:MULTISPECIES: ribonuclease HI [Thermoanaerobacter]ADH60924.1 Ribonuclease H [Thermoanaerobacter mathranii subsp. mathranii str. A3]MBT1279900.1 ribonuclease HI [Thermoanaerobacter sp. CM-CNRG TB177]MDK2815282.1 ribonuclease [Thermoanaerobacter sp.]MDP9751843.1 ribonuclease HI [Thermoanaerobacter pentosaceus]
MENNIDIVEIYTDGACSGNPGPGGWAAVLLYKEARKEISGFEENTTNNRMELKAVIEALKALKRPCKVNLYSDSSYVINAFKEGWLEKWQKNNWLKSDKTPVENQELWKELLEVSKRHQINWIKVKGHADDEFNNLCDRLATEQIKRNTKKL